MNFINYLKLIKKRGVIGIFKSIFRRISNIIGISVTYIIKSIVPLKNNYIVLESEGDFTDNVRVFYEYMIQNEFNNKYKLIWIVHEPQKYKKVNNVKFISRYSFLNLKMNYYCAISKFFIFSHPYWFKKNRKEQIVINTTHSVAQLKAPTANQKQIRFDYLLVCSPYCGEIKKKTFSIDNKHILNIGMPRIDLMFRHTRCIEQLLHNYHDEKIILSMQTFKQSETMYDADAIDPYALNVIHNEMEIKQLDAYLEANKCILINKIHHLQNMNFIKSISLKNIIYLTDSDLLAINCTVNNLLENANILLTDYSSVFYEFLLKDRPIGFLIGDMQQYSRGFIMENPLNEMPGKKLCNLHDVIDFLEHYQDYEKMYTIERERIKTLVFSHQDSQNCERLFHWIESQNRR